MKIGIKLMLGLLILAILVEITGLVAILSIDNIKTEQDIGPVKDNTIHTLLFLIFAGFFVSLGMGIILSYSIIRPIKELTRIVEEISLGNFDAEANFPERNDEIGKLNKAFSRILVSLKLAVRKTKTDHEKKQ